MQSDFAGSLEVATSEIYEFETPIEYKYVQMIHSIAKEHGQNLIDVRNKNTELDFWEMACLNSVESANLKKKDK